MSKFLNEKDDVGNLLSSFSDLGMAAVRSIRKDLLEDVLENHKGELEMVIVDLLTDLMHLCRHRDINFEACLTRSRYHFRCEVDEALKNIEKEKTTT